MSPQDICDFCGLSEGSATAGELQSTVDGSVVAHYYCMLFSPMVTEKDSQEDAEGFGFNIESVISEIDRGQKLRCTFCKKRGATVGCDVQSCKRNYHYPCLIRAKGKPIPRKFIVYCSKHKYSTNANDLERLQRKQKRKRQQKSTSRPRNNYIRNRRNDDDSERWQRDRKRTKLQNTAGRARKNDIRNHNDNNGDPHTTIMQNAQINDQRETTFLLAIHSAVKIDDSEEALPSTSGQPMSTGTSSEQSDSIRSPKVKNFFSLSGFPKRKKKYSSNRKPSKKLQEILQTMSSEEKKDLSQIYSELGGSESNLTTEMDAASDNQNGEMTTDDAMNTDVPKTSASSDNSERDKTPERLPDINVHGIPSRYSSEKKHFTEEQTVSSQDEKMPDKVSKSFSKRKRNLNNVISILHSTLSSDSDAPDRSAKDLQTQATSESHPSGRSSMTEPESILRSPLTLEKDGSKAEVSTSISDASVETMENDLSTSLLSNGESFPVTSPSNVTTLLKEKAQNKRRISNIASPQQIMAISRKLGTLTGQFRSIVPQIQSTINCPRRNTAKNAEQNADGHAPSKIPPKPKTSARPREATELKRLRSSAGWIVKRGHSRRQLSVKTLPAENNPHEPLRNWKTSDDSIRIKDLDKKESITSKRPRLQDHDELLPSRLPQRTEVKPPKQQDNPENQDDDNVTEDSLVEETETLRSEEYDQPSGHHSGPSEMITPVRRRLISLFPCRVSQSSFQHEGVEDLHDMDGFGSAVAGQCRRMPEDRQAKYMSYVLASADLFRGYAKLPDLEVLITNLRTGLARFQQSSSCGAIGSSD